MRTWRRTLGTSGRAGIARPSAGDPDPERRAASDRSLPLGRDAARIGRVTAEHPGRVVVATPIGGRRLLELPFGEALPRIC